MDNLEYWDNLEDKFQETHTWLRLNHSERENFSEPNQEFWFSSKKMWGPGGITEFYKTFKKGTSALLKLFQRIGEDRTPLR